MSQTKNLNYSDPQRNCFLVEHPTNSTENFNSLPSTMPTFGATDWGQKGVSNQKNIKNIFTTNVLKNRDVAIKFMQPIFGPADFSVQQNYNPDFDKVDFTFKNNDTSNQLNDNPQIGAAANISYPSVPTSIIDPNSNAEPVELVKGNGNSWGSNEEGIKNRGAFQIDRVLSKYINDN